VVATVERLIAANSVPGVRAALLALKGRSDSTPLLPMVTCPTLILCGEEDGTTPPADSEAMHRSIAGSRLVLLPKAGHLSNLESPDAFNAALKEFLAWISN
jgi:pimeloyl-ACP methyl ester carboxylesterase